MKSKGQQERKKQPYWRSHRVLGAGGVVLNKTVARAAFFDYLNHRDFKRLIGDLERKVAYIEGFRYDPRFGRGPLSVGQLVLRGPTQWSVDPGSLNKPS